MPYQPTVAVAAAAAAADAPRQNWHHQLCALLSPAKRSPIAIPGRTSIHCFAFLAACVAGVGTQIRYCPRRRDDDDVTRIYRTITQRAPPFGLLLVSRLPRSRWRRGAEAPQSSAHKTRDRARSHVRAASLPATILRLRYPSTRWGTSILSLAGVCARCGVVEYTVGFCVLAGALCLVCQTQPCVCVRTRVIVVELVVAVRCASVRGVLGLHDDATAAKRFGVRARECNRVRCSRTRVRTHTRRLHCVSRSACRPE